MQIDMHFYGVYTLARAAGIADRIARTIASSSQFVDDAIDDDEIVVSDQYGIVPIMTSHKPLDYQNAIKGDNWKVWLPFHFLPGNEPETGSFMQRLVCRKNSRVARKMLLDALDDRNRNLWPHLIGVTAHTYADTFAHYGFIGISTRDNIAKGVKTLNVKSPNVLKGIEEKLMEIAGKLAEVVPVGHGTVGVHPDIPFLHWQYQYETKTITKETIVRENAVDFLEGAKALHDFFGQYEGKVPEISDPQSKRRWEDIQTHVETIIDLQDENKNHRIDAWKKALRDGVFFPPSILDRGIQYNEWEMQLKRLVEIRATPENAHQDEACKFLRASQYHRYYVLNQLLPQFGILVN